MHFEFAYRGESRVQSSGVATEMSFVPDALRPPTFFVGELARQVDFREAVSALHDVVISDLRLQPKDRTEYMAWREKQELVDWARVAAEKAGLSARIAALQQELDDLTKRSQARWHDYHAARQRYFRFIYESDRTMWIVLDPVITVHPDEVFFEAFSQDESTYGRLGVSYEGFKNISERANGTTNIDYSPALYDEFQKLRTYRTTRFEIDPRGFEAKTDADRPHREVKIDLPDSWVRGLLQVSSAMTLPAHVFELHPIDVYNICFWLKRHRELVGPRALRWHLEPGRPVRVVLEPWEVSIECPRSVYAGSGSHLIRTWGRRRLLVLERLIAQSRKFTVFLLGTGMPSFFVADLGPMSFTLGLSGWTANDWAAAANFDLMAPRGDVDRFTAARVLEALGKVWLARPEALASSLGLSQATVLAALGTAVQAGRAMFDLNAGVYRFRELSREPLPLDALRFQNPREEAATRFLQAGAVKNLAVQGAADGRRTVQGTVADGANIFQCSMTLDQDERLVEGDCPCRFHVRNKLYKGPCEHLLALRMAEARARRN